MRLSKPIILLIVLVIISGAGFWLFKYLHKGEVVIYPPPYPAPVVNENGDPWVADFAGRIPCSDCNVLKFQLILYKNPQSGEPTTYFMDRISVGKGNDRIINKGEWTIGKGIPGYPDAVVYILDGQAPADLQNYWLVNDDILLPLDDNMNPRPGTAGYGYMLSRIQ